MGFRNPITSLRAEQIIPGNLDAGVIARHIATADAGRRVVISAAPGSAGTIDFWGDPDGPGQPEGHASIAVAPIGGVSGDATLEIAASDAIVRLRAEEVSGGGVRSVIDLEADRVRQAGDTEWTNAALAGTWQNYGPAPEQVAAHRRHLGRVELRGLVKLGTGTILTLPVGSRPAGNEWFLAVAGVGVAIVTVNTAGAVAVQSYAAGGTNGYVSLAGIEFTPAGA